MQLRGAFIPSIGATIFAVIGMQCGLYCQLPATPAQHLLGPRIDVAQASTPLGDAAADDASPDSAL